MSDYYSASSDWKNALYNGLVTQEGAPAKVSTGNITKPNHDKQIADHMIPTLEVSSNNSYYGRLSQPKTKNSIHTRLQFTNQE